MSSQQFPCIENTIDFPHEGRIIRLWIGRDHLVDPRSSDLVRDIRGQVTKLLATNPTHIDLLEGLAKIKRVNAVCVLERWMDNVRLGTVIYTVPFEDVHG